MSQIKQEIVVKLKGLSHGRLALFFINKAIFVWPWNENARKNRNNKRTETERFDWFIKRIQTRVAENFLEINRYFAMTSYGNTIDQSNNAFSISTSSPGLFRGRGCLHIRVFFGGKTKRLRFDLFIHWLIKQITNTYENHFQVHTKISLLPVTFHYSKWNSVWWQFPMFAFDF